MDLMLDMFMAFFGGYLVYAAVKMKQTGELAKGIIVSKDLDLSRARDIPGYIRYMYGKTVAMGLCALACGVTGVLTDLYGGLTAIQLVMSVVFFIVVVVFGVITSKAQKQFLGR